MLWVSQRQDTLDGWNAQLLLRSGVGKGLDGLGSEIGKRAFRIES